MVLTKTGTGRFKGAPGATVALRLKARPDTPAVVKPISAAYGATPVTVPANGTIKIPLVTGEQKVVIVYACTVEKAWLDLVETDTGGTQKLRATSFDPEWPTVSITITGQ